MGWAVGQFGNDTALDFVGAVKTFADVRAVIQDDSNFAPDLDSDDACIALAVCEMLATAIGRSPEDFIGYCYICYGMVTEGDGLEFTYDDPDGGSVSNSPHRKCIEDKMDEPGPYWTEDGSPAPVMRKALMRGLGYDV